MVELCKNGVYLFKGRTIVEDRPENRMRLSALLPPGGNAKEEARRGTISSGIIRAHNSGVDAEKLALRFDALASHDITFVNIIQTARVSGLESFPVPYYLTNCHNSLCAVGGTINEDDHLFGLSAARKYGGVYVPPHLAVIHSFIREAAAGCGKMILGSDSHTRYGALGTMGVGEGGGELVKQLLGQSYDFACPRVIAVYLTGSPRNGTGPQDAALAIIGAVFRDGFVKNAVLEFVGDGIAGLPIDFRAGIDVMTTETTCWSSVWETDETVKEFLETHHRAADYRRLAPADLAYYDGLIKVDLSSIRPMIALPFHPSNVYEIDDVLSSPLDIFARVEREAAAILEDPALALRLQDKVEGKGKIRIDQGIIAGCAGGTFDNIMAAAAILKNPSGAGKPGGAFSLSIYPGSQPVLLELAKNGAVSDLIAAGAVIRSCFCGPCFGAGDVPANNGLSVRHTTRNFPNREGSKPGDGQIASVALMDARSVAATARNGGYLASAEALELPEPRRAYHFDDSPYRARIYNGAGKPDPAAGLVYGPNIADWPPMEALGSSLLLKIVSFITDPVTTTDELIPSGETSSFRSNPQGLAEYTLSRKDPGYVPRAKAIRAAERLRLADRSHYAEQAETLLPELPEVFAGIRAIPEFAGVRPEEIQLGSALFAHRPGDGSAREQAASCQKVLGGAANFANEYATKRYRSNLINWGIIPFTLEGTPPFRNGDYVFIPGIRRGIAEKTPALSAWVIGAGGPAAFSLGLPELTDKEARIMQDGSLINYNRRLAEEKKH
jgi:aconitate hydratase